MSKKKYIDYGKLLEERYRLGLDEMSRISKVNAFNHFIDTMPLADVKEVWYGEWIEKEHWIPLPRDYEVSYDSDYDDCYDEKTHSWKEKHWHCSCCDYEASRDTKPVYKYCPNCGAKMDKEMTEER